MKEVANTKAFELLMDYQSEMIDNSCVLLALSKELGGFIENSPYHPAYNGSIIDLIGGLSETTTSKIIKMIFCYKGEQHDYPLLNHFITTFIGHPLKVQKPIIEAEIGRIDISVRDKSYALIFENKLKTHHYLIKNRWLKNNPDFCIKEILCMENCDVEDFMKLQEN